MERVFALVKDSRDEARVVHHYRGPPPVVDPNSEAELMGRTRLVLLIPDSYGIKLYRFDRSGADAGDTWHEKLDHVQKQLVYEFGGGVSQWRKIPAEINDLEEFAKRLLRTDIEQMGQFEEAELK